jgi:glycosyltransferase involved in cell wall biosynthesis
MKYKPLISVIVPIYNSEKYIKRCIESILDQTYRNFELILIDDGSSDSSYKICYKYAENNHRIKVLKHPNKGVSFTRNVGIQYSRGEYVTFVDSDDWVDPHYLEDFLSHKLIKNSIVIQGIKYDFWNNTSKILFAYPDKIYQQDSLNKGIVSHKLFHNGCPVAKLFEKDVLIKNNIRFNENISLNEDHLFVLEYYKYVENIILLSNINYHYYFDYFETTLTKQINSYSMLMEISNQFMNILPILIEKYNLKDHFYISSIYTTCGINQLVKAIINSYYIDEKIGAKDKFKKTKELTPFIIENYKPQDLYLKISKFFIVKFNYKINHYFFYLLAKWLKVKKSITKIIKKILHT